MAAEINKCTNVFSGQQKCKIIELEGLIDHAHLIEMVAPKISVSDCAGTVKFRGYIKANLSEVGFLQVC
jgi:REP element-mobilizing transposase RayT